MHLIWNTKATEYRHTNSRFTLFCHWQLPSQLPHMLLNNSSNGHQKNHWTVVTSHDLTPHHAVTDAVFHLLWHQEVIKSPEEHHSTSLWHFSFRRYTLMRDTTSYHPTFLALALPMYVQYVYLPVSSGYSSRKESTNPASKRAEKPSLSCWVKPAFFLFDLGLAISTEE